MPNIEEMKVLHNLFSFTLFCIALLFLLTSCATLSGFGVGRVQRYNIRGDSLPQCFDGFKVAFVSDLHYPSLFGKKRLRQLTKKLQSLNVELLLLGGDYVTDNECIDELFSSLSSVKTSYGCYAVLGNHERKNYKEIIAAAHRNGITMLVDSAVYIKRDTDSISIVGIKNSFDCSCNVHVNDGIYTLLLCHTPDYAECYPYADIVFSGHTHGGQVSLFGLYTPVKNSVYGSRFLRGLNYTTANVPVITTTGVGTSRRRLRLCVPSELVVVTMFKD